MASEMSPEEILVLDEWLCDVKGMTFALILANISSCNPSTSTTIPLFVSRAEEIVRDVNEELAGIAQATLAKRDRRLDSLDSKADTETPS